MVFIDVKVERMIWIARIMRMALLRLGPTDNLAQILNDGFTGSDILQRKYAFAVYAGAPDLNAPTSYRGGFFAHFGTRVKNLVS